MAADLERATLDTPESGLALSKREFQGGVIEKAKPQTSKGAYLKKASISTTMGPGVRLDPGDIHAMVQ